MKTDYLKRSWAATRKEPGWWKTVLILTLVQLIPIFGQIVALGYLYQWGRDAAWGVERGLPTKVGDLNSVLKTGAIAFVITFCGNLIISAAVSLLTSVPILDVVFGVISVPVLLAVSLLLMVMVMRGVIYNSFEPGLQISQAWQMAKKDPLGLLKIFGISCLALIPLVVLGIPFGLLIFAVCTAVDPSVAFVLAVVLLLVVLCFAYAFCATVVSAWTTRALGYWFAPFQPNTWGPSKEGIPAGTGSGACSE